MWFLVSSDVLSSFKMSSSGKWKQRQRVIGDLWFLDNIVQMYRLCKSTQCNCWIQARLVDLDVTSKKLVDFLLFPFLWQILCYWKKNWFAQQRTLLGGTFLCYLTNENLFLQPVFSQLFEKTKTLSFNYWILPTQNSEHQIQHEKWTNYDQRNEIQPVPSRSDSIVHLNHRKRDFWKIGIGLLTDANFFFLPST